MAALFPLPDDPLVAEVEEFARRHRLAERAAALDRAPEFPWTEFRAMGAAGLLGLTVPPDRGGRGLPSARAATLLYRLAYLGGTAFAKLALQPEFSSVLGEHGGRELREAWYAPLLRGERLVGNQVTEPGAGSDVAALATRAAPEGPDVALSGTKSEIAFAKDAGAAIVYARRPGSIGREGISAFLVPQDGPGVERTIAPVDLGERWQRRGTVVYRSAPVPPAARLGEEGRGLEYLRPELARERGLLAAIYLGVARASWDETVAFVGERVAFGHRLAEAEGVAFPLVDDGVQLEAAWDFVRGSLEALDRGLGGEAPTAAAKVLACETALRTLDHAVQFHGGRGYSSALPHERRWRDVRSGTIAHGTSEVLRRTVARGLWPRARSGNP